MSALELALSRMDDLDLVAVAVGELEPDLITTTAAGAAVELELGRRTLERDGRDRTMRRVARWKAHLEHDPTRTMFVPFPLRPFVLRGEAVPK